MIGVDKSRNGKNGSVNRESSPNNICRENENEERGVRISCVEMYASLHSIQGVVTNCDVASTTSYL